MRVVAMAIVALALVIGIVPQYTHCKTGASMAGSATKTAMTGNGLKTATAAAPAQPMRCYWSARAEIGVAVPLGLTGVLLVLGRRKETRRFLALLGAALGAVAMLVPTVLIGVCPTATAVCHTTMRPTLLAAGGLVVALSVVALVLNELRPADTEGGEVARAVATPRAPIAVS